MEQIARVRARNLPSLAAVQASHTDEAFRACMRQELRAHRPLYEMLVARRVALYATVEAPPTAVPWQAIEASECGAAELMEYAVAMRRFVHPPLQGSRDIAVYMATTAQLLGYVYDDGPPAAQVGGDAARGRAMGLADAVAVAREEAGESNAHVSGALLLRARVLREQSLDQRR